MKKKLLTITYALLSVVLTASSLAPAAGAIQVDRDFYSSNDIIFFDPTTSVTCSPVAGSGGAANIDVAKDFSLGDDKGQRAVNLVKALMKDFGFTAEQASGIVGNFMHESGGAHLPPDINENTSTGAPPKFVGGYGWAQWTGGRQKSFIKFAVDNGFMASQNEHATDAANYAYLKHELINTSEKTAVDKVKATSTTDDSTTAFEKAFERAGKPLLEERKKHAREVLTAFNGGGSVATDGQSGGGTGATAANCPTAGGSGLVGDKAFPLKTTKQEIDAKNKGLFKDGNTGKSGHNYLAYDIMIGADTEVTAFMGGVVTLVTSDRCPGRMISIYNEAADVTVSYLHMKMSPNTHVALGDQIQPGQKVGEIAQLNTGDAGCNMPHLHIDVVKGKTRPGCSRLSCPASNANKFIDVGADLYKTYEALP